MARRKISNAATATLERWLDGFQQGRLHFGELPLALEAWLHTGYALGRESRQAEIERLERDANRYYSLAFATPRQRRDELEQRLSKALETATPEQWDRIEADLAVMAAARYLNSSDDGASAPESGKARDIGNRVLEEP